MISMQGIVHKEKLTNNESDQKTVLSMATMTTDEHMGLKSPTCPPGQ